MPDINWRYVAPAGLGIIVALLLATIIGLKLQPEDPKLRADGGYEEIDSAYQAGGASCNPVHLNALAGRNTKREKDRCQEAKEQHREAANSLIEARRQADAANASAVLAYKQTAIAGWGTSFGFATMVAAILAAIYAAAAAHHTRRSADYAESALHANRARLMYDTFEAQFANFHTPEGEQKGILIHVKFKNFGQSPAVNARMFTYTDSVEHAPFTKINIDEREAPEFGQSFAPGQQLSIDPINIYGKFEEAVNARKMTPYIYILVLYNDIFTDKVRKTAILLTFVRDGTIVSADGSETPRFKATPVREWGVLT